LHWLEIKIKRSRQEFFKPRFCSNAQLHFEYGDATCKDLHVAETGSERAKNVEVSKCS
jgi:hypothetical protein